MSLPLPTKNAPLVRVTVLGSGTSMGVPSLGCHCRVCTSKDPRDNRLRPSLLLSRGEKNIIIDTTKVATDTIDYVATDQSGLTSTSTCTAIIEPAPPSIAPSGDSATSSTDTSPSAATATTPASLTAN